MAIEWKDRTSYSQSDKERIPTTWVALVGDIDIVVHKHIWFGKSWLLSSNYLSIDKESLSTEILDEARLKAVRLVKKYITEDYKKLEKALDELKGF